MSKKERLVKMDSDGRITIPKAMRDELHIAEGSVLSLLVVKGKKLLIIEPVVSTFDVLAEEAEEDLEEHKRTERR